MTKISLSTAYKNLAIHVIVWLLVIQLIFDVSGLYHSLSALVTRETLRFDEAFLAIPLLIALFYVNRNVLVPKYLHRQSWLRYLIALFATLLSFQGVAFGLAAIVQYQGFHFDGDLEGFFDFFMFFNVSTLAISSSLGIAQVAFQNAAQRDAAQAEQKKSELKYLANQFNPHFLFNTLNGIYAKAIEEDAPATSEAIVRLSEIMRFPIHRGLQKEVSLAEEVRFIEDFIDLQRLRLGDHYPIHFEKGHDLEGIKIMPLSLIVLVENAFKYGVSQKDQCPIFFHLTMDGDFIQFESQNRLTKEGNLESHKLGMRNLRTRLDILYGGGYTLATETVDDQYRTRLRLKKW